MTYSFVRRALFVCFVLLLSAPAVLFAQSPEGIGVRIQPTLFEDRAEPGATMTGTFTVTNTSEIAQQFFLSARNVTGVDPSGRPSFSREQDDISGTLASWVTLTERSIELAPGASMRIGFTASVPEDASPGTHFGGVFVDRPADQVNTSGAGVGYMVGALLSIQVGGDIVESLRITEFSTDRSFYTDASAGFSIAITNEGNIYDEVQGFITINDMFGKTIDTVDVDSFRAVPGYERRVAKVWEGTGFHIGRYTAVLDLVHGQENRTTISREVRFWVVPVGTLGLVLGLIFVGLLALYVMVRVYVRRQLARAGYSARKKAGAPATALQQLSTLLVVLLVLSLGALVILMLFFA
jgi:hypothetical protein